MNTKSSKLVLDMAVVAIFTGLNFIVTYFVAIPIPGTSGAGYINLSDVFVFFISALINPLVGGISGGLAGLICDLSLGYGFFAPFTLAIKFIEGVISGYLFRFLIKIGNNSKSTIYFKSLISFIIGGLIMAILYMVPDFITFLTVPSSQGGNSYYFIFYDLGINSIQGSVNAVIGSLIYIGLSQIKILKNQYIVSSKYNPSSIKIEDEEDLDKKGKNHD